MAEFLSRLRRKSPYLALADGSLRRRHPKTNKCLKRRARAAAHRDDRRNNGRN